MKIRSKDIGSLLSDESFQRWLEGSAALEENKVWEMWRTENEENSQLYLEARQLWQATRFQWLKAPDIDGAAQRLSLRLHQEHDPLAIPNYRLTARTIDWRHYAIAAVVVLGLLTGWALWQAVPGSTIYQTDYAQRKTVELPDGSQIILNGNSRVTVDGNFSHNPRLIVKLSGEAYFSVVKVRANSAFQVHTSDGIITVTGTRFAVNDRGDGSRISLEEGAVSVSLHPGKNTPNVAHIRPGETLFFARDDPELEPQRLPLDPYLTWWKSDLVFQETPVSEILQRIEATYGVDIKVLNPALFERTLSGSLENSELEIILSGVAQALQTEWSINGKQVVLGSQQSL